MAMTQTSLSRAPRPSSLADVLDLILDKGLVIDAYVRVSVIGIEVLTVDARVVVASVDTYLRFAEAVNRLDLTQTETAGLKELREGAGGKGSDGDGDGMGKRAMEGAKRALSPSRRDEGEGGGDDEGHERGFLGRIAERGKWSS